MGGTPLLGGSWGPILQLDMENWIEFLEVLNLPYNILDFVQGPFFPDDLLKSNIFWIIILPQSVRPSLMVCPMDGKRTIGKDEARELII